MIGHATLSYIIITNFYTFAIERKAIIIKKLIEVLTISLKLIFT